MLDRISHINVDDLIYVFGVYVFLRLYFFAFLFRFYHYILLITLLKLRNIRFLQLRVIINRIKYDLLCFLLLVYSLRLFFIASFFIDFGRLQFLLDWLSFGKLREIFQSYLLVHVILISLKQFLFVFSFFLRRVQILSRGCYSIIVRLLFRILLSYILFSLLLNFRWFLDISFFLDLFVGSEIGK